MCTVNEESTASETDLAPGRGRGPVFPGSRPRKKNGGEHIPRLFPTTFVYAAKFVHTVMLPLMKHCFTYGSISR